MSTPKKAVVIGGSYVGMMALGRLTTLEELDVTLVEKNSHFQHLFAFPRISAVPGFQHKAFVPYVAPFLKPTPPAAPRGGRGPPTGFKPPPSPVSTPHLVRGVAQTITPTSVLLSDGDEIPYDYLVMATGTSGSSSSAYTTLGADNTAGLEMVGTEKKEEVARFRGLQKEVESAKRVAVVGGGAYGVQLALDIAEFYPNQKEVILIHSRNQLMNRFHGNLHDGVMKQCERFGVQTRLGQRVKEIKNSVDGSEKVVVFMDGQQVVVDCVIPCTGSRPLSAPLLTLDPQAVDPASGFIKVKNTLQIDSPKYPNIFAIGDVADTGAHKAARPALQQVEVVTNNIHALMAGSSDMDTYKPQAASIHLSLGLTESVKFMNPANEGENPAFHAEADGKMEVGCGNQWASKAPGVEDFDA